MAALYVDEDVPAFLVRELIALGHDVLTAVMDGRANQGIDDHELLARATELKRILLTLNRWDFHRLHELSANHMGIVTCTDDSDSAALAARIDRAIRHSSNLTGKLLRVVRPNKT
jgi:hypothetical protein